MYLVAAWVTFKSYSWLLLVGILCFRFGYVEVMKLMQRKESSVNDSCLASVEGTIERTLEFHVVFEHTTSLKSVGCSNQSASENS